MTVPQIVGLGDAVVDRYIERGVMHPGGSACNVAVYSRRLGFNSGFVGGLSEDSAGRWIFEALETEGVDVSQVQFYEAAQAYADVKIAIGGAREFGSWRPTPVSLELDPERLEYLAKAAFVHTSYSSLLNHHVEHLSEKTHVTFDFSYKDLSYATALLPHLTGAFFSRSEFTTDEAIALVSHVHSLGPRLVVATQGERGAVVLLDGEVIVQPATHMEEVTDTLGAGDAFAARLLAGLVTSESVGVAAQAASDFAASVCVVDGAFGWPLDLAAEVRQV